LALRCGGISGIINPVPSGRSYIAASAVQKILNERAQVTEVVIREYGRIGCPWVAESKMPLLALENSADFWGIFFRLKEPMVE
jgi:hypothetical protein